MRSCTFTAAVAWALLCLFMKRARGLLLPQPPAAACSVRVSMSVGKPCGKAPGAEVSRTEVLRVAAGFFVGLLSASGPLPAGAKQATEKVNREMGQAAFGRIKGARKQLDGVDPLLRQRDFEEAAAQAGEPPLVDIEKALLELVTSNVLDAEDKVAMGTIRRYGVAADALIMLGGLNAALRDEDGGEAYRYLRLAKESINDIINIGYSNGLQ